MDSDKRQTSEPNSDFKSIVFGKTDAYKEKRVPGLLSDGFFDEGYIRKIINGDKYYVFGPKGSGKSAIGTRIAYLADTDKDMVVCQRELGDFNYSGFNGVMSGSKSPVEKIHDTWKFLLSVSILNLYNNDSVFVDKNGPKFKDVISLLRSWGLAPNSNFNTIIDTLIHKDWKLSLGDASISCSDIPHNETDKRRMITTVNGSLLKFHPSVQHFIVIDGLDDILTNTKKQYDILSGLIHVTNDLNQTLEDNSIDVRIVVLCRNDLLDRIADPNKTKYITDSGIRLDWYQSDGELEDNNLCKLINLRASVSLGRNVDVFREFFPRYINIGNHKKKTAEFLLDHTRHIPRDLIQIMNNIQEVSYSKASESSIKKGIKKYSEDYFLSEIQDSCFGFLTQDEIDQTFDIIRRIGYNTTTIQEMSSYAKDLGYEVDLKKTLPVLYNECAIGNVTHSGNPKDNGGKAFYSFKYRNRTIPFNEKKEIQIHPGLYKALGLISREDNLSD